MNFERAIDLVLTAATLGTTAWMGYSILKKAGIIKTRNTLRIRGKKVTMGDAEMELYRSCAIDPSTIETDFDTIGGHEEIKKIILRNVVFPFYRPDLFPIGSLRSPPKGLLLYGPPGTGKTMLAKAIAKEANAFFMDVKIESLFSKWVGESEQNTAAVFKLAQLCQPTIIFIDEIDSLLSDRGSGSDGAVYNNAKTIFLRHWDGFHSSTDRIVVIGATNMPHVLDPAVLRRMPIQIEVPLPTPEERMAILTVMLSGEDTTMIDFTTLVEHTEKYSGSDLRSLCVDACSRMVYDAVTTKKGDTTMSVRLRMEHFKEAREGRKPVVPPPLPPPPMMMPDLSGMSPEKLQMALQTAVMLMAKM